MGIGITKEVTVDVSQTLHKLIVNFNEWPFNVNRLRAKSHKPKLAVLRAEVLRRCKLYNIAVVRPSQWKMNPCMEWLVKNPIPLAATKDYDYFWS